MKRIALVLAAIMIVSLCACGEIEVPTTTIYTETTAPTTIAPTTAQEMTTEAPTTARSTGPSVTLHVTTGIWWGLGTPGSKSKTQPDREVWEGDIITIEDDFLGDSTCTIKIIYIFPEGVQVYVEAEGLVYAPGDGLMIFKWGEQLEYLQERELGKKAMDTGASLCFSFS